MQSSWNPPASQVDYRAIRDLLRTGKLAAASDAHLTPPPPLHSQAHVFRAPPGPPQPAHPDVWGSEQHPYDSKPEGMKTLLKTGGTPVREDSQESEENLPEPPVVMRRTRFFAAVRSCLLELRSRVDEGVAGFIAPAEADGDDDPTGFSRALLSKEERDELELAEALKKKALSDAIEGAFDEALESLGTMMYKVFQYAGSKHMALERLRDNIEQRDDMLMERMQQEAGASVERVEEETMKLQDAEGTFEERREEWRKMLLMSNSRAGAERELQRDVVALKRGMRQLLADAEAAESRHGTLIAVERQKRRDETANLQQAVHESDKHAQRIQESLAAKMKELEETQIKMDELHKLVSGQEKQMEKQKERMTQSHKLEAQLREFFHMQGGRSLEAWHKGVKGIFGPTVHDDELTNGQFGFGKAVVELMSQQKLIQATRWVRNIYPESWPAFRPTRKRIEIPPSPSGPSSNPSTPGRKPPAEAPKAKPATGALFLPPTVRRLVADARDGGASTPAKATHDAIAEVYKDWLDADEGLRQSGLANFALLWCLKKEGAVKPAEDRFVVLLSCAAAHGAGLNASPRCKAFSRLAGISELPPAGCGAACLQAWGLLVNPNSSGGAAVENDVGLIYVGQDRIKPAVEATGAASELRKTMASKIKAMVRPENNKKARTYGMVCADEVMGVILEEWARDYSSGMETKLQRLIIENDKRVDGSFTLEEFVAVVDGACGDAGGGYAPEELNDMYLRSAEASASAGATDGKLIHGAIVEAARFYGWGAKQMATPRGKAETGDTASTWALLEPLISAQISEVSAGGSIDTKAAEALLARCRDAAKEGTAADLWAALKPLLSAHADAVLKALQQASKVPALPPPPSAESSASPRKKSPQGGSTPRGKGAGGTKKGKAQQAVPPSDSSPGAGSRPPSATKTPDKPAAGGGQAEQLPDEGVPSKEPSFDLRSTVEDPELQRKLKLMEETVSQQLDMAQENLREMEGKLQAAEARAAAAEGRRSKKEGTEAAADGPASVQELEARLAGSEAKLAATEEQLMAEMRRAANAEHRSATNLAQLSHQSEHGAAVVDNVATLSSALKALRLEQQALAAEARHQKASMSGVLHEAMESLVRMLRAQGWGAALAASALASARDSVASGGDALDGGDAAGSSSALSGGLSGEMSGYLAAPRPMPDPVPGVPSLHPAISIDDELNKLLGGISSESSFARRVELDLKQYELDIRGMRYDSRVDGLDELVESSLTPHDAASGRARLAGVVEGQEDMEEEDEDMLLEETSKGNVAVGPDGEKLDQWDGENEQRELIAVADLLESEPSSARQRNGAELLLAELSVDTFLHKGPQVPGVEQMVWEGLGGSDSGLKPPKAMIGYSARAHMPSEGAHSNASDWDRDFEPFNPAVSASRAAAAGDQKQHQGGDEMLVAEGTVLLHSRSEGATEAAAPQVTSEAVSNSVDIVREAAKVVDSEALELERKVEKVRAANAALMSRAEYLDSRAERMRVASNMLQRQVESLRAKGNLVRKERDALQAEHGRLRSNRDRLAAVATKIKSRKFNLRAAEAIYVRKWQHLEQLAQDLINMQAALATSSADLEDVGAVLILRAQEVGMEMSPMMLPPPHVVEMPVVASAAKRRSTASSASSRPVSAGRPGSAKLMAAQRPSSPGGQRPGSAKLPSHRPGSPVGSSHYTVSVQSSLVGTNPSRAPSPSHYLAGRLGLDEFEGNQYVVGDHQETGIGGGVVGRPVSAGGRSRRSKDISRAPSPAFAAHHLHHPPAAAFAAQSGNWLDEGGDVRDAPRELHEPLRQLYALSMRLHHASAAFASFGNDVLSCKPATESVHFGDTSPRDFLDTLANPPTTVEDPAMMAALVAEVIQARIDRASAKTQRKQLANLSHQSRRSPHRSSDHGMMQAAMSSVEFQHQPGEFPAAPGPTPRYGPAAELRSQPTPGLMPTSAVKRMEDLETLCRNLMDQSSGVGGPHHHQQGQQQKRAASSQRRRPSRPVPAAMVPGTDILLPAGPVLGGHNVPRELRPLSAREQTSSRPQSNRRSPGNQRQSTTTDMLSAVTRGVQQHVQQAGSSRSQGPMNRRMSNSLNKPLSASALGIGPPSTTHVLRSSLDNGKGQSQGGPSGPLHVAKMSVSPPRMSRQQQ